MRKPDVEAAVREILVKRRHEQKTSRTSTTRGNAHMVDVGAKDVTERVAVARATVPCSRRR